MLFHSLSPTSHRLDLKILHQLFSHQPSQPLITTQSPSQPTQSPIKSLSISTVLSPLTNTLIHIISNSRPTSLRSPHRGLHKNISIIIRSSLELTTSRISFTFIWKKNKEIWIWIAREIEKQCRKLRAIHSELEEDQCGNKAVDTFFYYLPPKCEPILANFQFNSSPFFLVF